MTIAVASAPLSWGIHEAERERYPYAQVLDQIHSAGYAGTELGPWGYLPTDPALLRDELAQRELRLTSGAVRVRLTDPDAQADGAAAVTQVARLLAALDANYLILIDEVEPDSRPARQAGRVRAPRLDEDAMTAFAAGVNRIARQVHDDTGLRTVFQHHVGTHIEIDEEVGLLLDQVDSDLVGLCVDTGHWRYAGGDPVDAIREHGERVWYVHLTDCDPNIRQFCIDEQLTFDEATQAGVLCSLGEGNVDFTAMIRHLQRLNYDGWVVAEQAALADDPRLSARNNRDFLRQLGV